MCVLLCVTCLHFEEHGEGPEGDTEAQKGFGFQMLTEYAGPNRQLSKSAKIPKQVSLRTASWGQKPYQPRREPYFSGTCVPDLTTHCTKPHDVWWYGVPVINKHDCKRNEAEQ